MGIRGPKSSASLSVVRVGDVEATQRPKPPAHLPQDQRGEWLAVVNRMPADWFQDETLACLEAYCAHAVNCRWFGQMLAEMRASDQVDMDEVDRVSRLHERESRAMSSLATRLRITPQSTYDAKKKKPLQVAEPWKSPAD